MSSPDVSVTLFLWLLNLKLLASRAWLQLGFGFRGSLLSWNQCYPVHGLPHGTATRLRTPKYKPTTTQITVACDVIHKRQRPRTWGFMTASSGAERNVATRGVGSNNVSNQRRGYRWDFEDWTNDWKILFGHARLRTRNLERGMSLGCILMYGKLQKLIWCGSGWTWINAVLNFPLPDSQQLLFFFKFFLGHWELLSNARISVFTTEPFWFTP